MGVKARERRKEGGRKEGKEGGREEGRKEGGREEGRKEGGRKGGREGGREEGKREEGRKEGGREEGRKEGGREAGRSSCVYGKRKTYYDVPTFSPEWRQTQVVCGQEEATPTSVQCYHPTGNEGGVYGKLDMTSLNYSCSEELSLVPRLPHSGMQTLKLRRCGKPGIFLT